MFIINRPSLSGTRSPKQEGTQSFRLKDGRHLVYQAVGAPDGRHIFYYHGHFFLWSQWEDIFNVIERQLK